MQGRALRGELVAGPVLLGVPCAACTHACTHLSHSQAQRHKHSHTQLPAFDHSQVRKEFPVHSSNVMLYSKTAGVRSRVGHKVDEASGKKVRYLVKTGEIID